MKKLLIILIALVTILSGCRYKEGPLISFRSVEKRICGIWQVVEFTSDGIDSLKYYNDSCGSKMILNFRYPDGSPMSDPIINFVYGKKEFYGSLYFSDNKKIMNVLIDGGSLSWNLGPIGNAQSNWEIGNVQSNWKILKLTEKDLKISTSFNGRNYIISFKKE
jgi:hypothetical protein